MQCIMYLNNRPLAKVVPSGTFDFSPAIYRWEQDELPCPVGTLETPFSRPYGTGETLDISPSDESLGYYQLVPTGLLQEV